MKKFFLGIITVIFLGAVAFGAYYLGTKKPVSQNEQTTIISPTNNPVVATIQPSEAPKEEPSPTVATQNDSDLIKAALFKKNNWPANENLNFTLSTNDGTYASGGVSGQGGGGYFFAAKVNGEWIIVADGNGTISCSSLASYPNFPTSLIPECWDETTGKSVKR